MSKAEQRTLTSSDLEQLLGKKVTNIETKNLTAPGDNYGSIMLAVDVTLDTGEKLPLVAKMFPITQFVQNIFQSPKTMKKEIEVYQIISAEYEKIQEEQLVPPSERLHVFCNCPGARLSLEDDDKDQLADENSVLLLENLKVQGYRTGDRTTGFDLKHTEFILKHLAKFHATAVAIKMKKPLVFRNKIVNVLTPFKSKIVSKEEDVKRNAGLFEGLKIIPACSRNIDALREVFKKHVEFSHSGETRPFSEPFATFAHYDFWINNMMLKYESAIDDTPIDYKMVDFQASEYGSPVADIMLFLFTSTQSGLISEHVDHFLDLYYNTFVDWLATLGCETNKFSREGFLEEVKNTANRILFQIIFMLIPITFNKEQAEEFGDGIPKEEKTISFNELYKTKFTEAIDTYVDKGWL